MDRPVRAQLIAIVATVIALGTASCAPVFSGGGAPQPSASATTAVPIHVPAPSHTVTPPTGGVPATPVPTTAPVSPTSLPTVPAPPATSAPPATATSRPAATMPPAPTNPPAGPNPPAPPSGAEALEAEIVRLVNVERGKVGCAPLTVHPALATAARNHSADMAANDYFSHDSQSGTGPSERAQAAGYPSPYVSENIAAGYSDPVRTMQLWMNSDGHRRNILECNTTQIGVGYATGGSYGHYWTQDFGNAGGR